MPPPVLPSKTLHQRTKSVPAFSTLRSEANKPMPAVDTSLLVKRVLGDVNPNLKVLQTAKDDLSLGKSSIKQAIQAAKVSLGTKDESRMPGNIAALPVALPLSRPALRPQGAKSFSTLTISSTAAAISSAPSAEPHVIKKSVKVLKEAEHESTTDNAVPAPNPVTKVDDLPQEKLAQPLTADAAAESVVQHAVEICRNVDAPAVESLPVQALSQIQHPPGFTSEKEYIIHLEKQAEYFEQRTAQSRSTLPSYAVGEMPVQQCFVEEEYDYYEDGYTTARSFGLSGESTGAFTTILAPKASEKIRIEIDAAKKYVESVRTPEDVDDELWDTSMVAEYGDDIFAYMRKLEDRMLPDPRYMDIQQEIQWSMRAVLVDWVVQVHQRFTLLPETLFLAINYIDRFLSHKVVSLGKLQLVGATALFIAAKFEEVNCPTLQEVIFMVDGGYTVDELLKAERFMLSMLQFDLGWPGPMSFLRRISKADDYDLETRTLAKYFLEVTVMDERFIGCTPSFLAAGAHCLARVMLRKGEWTVAHVAYSEYTYAQLRPLLHGITECCDNPRRHHLSVYEKYTDKRYKRASTFVEAEILKGFTLHPRMSVRSSFGTGLPALTGFT